MVFPFLAAHGTHGTLVRAEASSQMSLPSWPDVLLHFVTLRDARFRIFSDPSAPYE